MFIRSHARTRPAGASAVLTGAGAAVVTAAGVTARNAARSGGIGAISASVRAAAQAGTLRAALGRGTVPVAMADAVWAVAEL